MHIRFKYNQTFSQFKYKAAKVKKIIYKKPVNNSLIQGISKFKHIDKVLYNGQKKWQKDFATISTYQNGAPDYIFYKYLEPYIIESYINRMENSKIHGGLDFAHKKAQIFEKNFVSEMFEKCGKPINLVTCLFKNIDKEGKNFNFKNWLKSNKI